MHLRVASTASRTRGLTARFPAAAAAALAVALCAAAACNRAPEPGEISVAWRVDPSPPSIAEGTRVLLTVRDSVTGAVSGAHLKIEAHMAMPGMSPYLAEATDQGNGTYEAPVRFSMRGDWILVVDGTLPDGRRVTRNLDIRDVR